METPDPQMGPAAPGRSPQLRSVPAAALWQTLLALLGLYPGLCPSLPAAPRPRPPDPRADLDSVVSLAKALLSDTKAFLQQLVRPPETPAPHNPPHAVGSPLRPHRKDPAPQKAPCPIVMSPAPFGSPVP